MRASWKWALGCFGGVMVVGVVVVGLLVAGLLWMYKGKGDLAGPAAAASAASRDLYGTYYFVSETSGTSPVKGAAVTLRLVPPDRVLFRATKPGEVYGDMGTFAVKDGRMTIHLADLEQEAADAAYSFDGSKLVLPIVVLGEGKGSSTWTKRPAKADPLEKVSDTFWEHYNTDGPVVALEKAAEAARSSPDVAAATIGGRTLLIAYKSGQEEFFLAPKLLGELKKGTSEAPAMEAEPVAAEEVPANLFLGQIMPAQGLTDFLKGPAGSTPGSFDRYADWLRYQPEPISSGDAPPDKRALLFSPFHSLPHYEHVPDVDPNALAPLVPATPRGRTRAPAPKPEPKKLGTKLPVFGENEKLEEIEKHLEKIDYMVLPYMDSAVDLELIYKKLHGHNWGVIYFNTHCGEVTRRIDKDTVEHTDMLLATGDQIPDAYAESPRDRAAYLERTGRAALGADYERLKNTLIEGKIDESGVYFIAVKSKFFSSINCDYSKTLVFLNGCESAKFPDFRREFNARSFVGWTENAQIEMGSRVCEPFFRCLTCKTFADREAVYYAINYAHAHYYQGGDADVSRHSDPVGDSHRYWEQRQREDATTWNFNNLVVYRHGQQTPEKPFPFHVANLMRVSRRWATMGTGLAKTLDNLDDPDLDVGLKGTPFYKEAFNGQDVPKELVDEAKFELGGGHGHGKSRFTLVEK